MLADDVGVLRARAAMFHRALERTERLLPLAARAAVPEEPRVVRGTDDGHRTPSGGADAVGERDVILKVLRRQMARSARHLAVATQARIEEQRLSQRRGARIVTITIARIRLELLEARQRE